MSAFLDDHVEDMKDPQYAYEFGRYERDLEIIKLLEEFIDNCDLPEVVDRFEWLKDALIEGKK